VALWADYAMLTRSQNHQLFAHSEPSSNGLERNSATKGLSTCDAGDGGRVISPAQHNPKRPVMDASDLLAHTW